MKLKFILLLALALVAGNLVRAERLPLTVAVYDFHGVADAKTYGEKVTALVTADLSTDTNFVMLERADLKKVLNEQAFDISGMVNSDAAAQIGQITGVKVLVAGQVIKTDGNRVIIVANIIGTETSRLFSTEVAGGTDRLPQLIADLSRKITRTISEQAAHLVAPKVESHTERIERIIESIKGTNRPSVSVNLTTYNYQGGNWPDTTATGEFGVLLLKAGFTVVDDASDTRPEVTIVGSVGVGGSARGELFTSRTVVEVKVQNRRTGKILYFGQKEATATDLSRPAAYAAATIKASDELAARVLPLLAQ